MSSKIEKKFYAKKCAKHIACCHEYKLVCFNDKFSKPFKI